MIWTARLLGVACGLIAFCVSCVLSAQIAAGGDAPASTPTISAAEEGDRAALRALIPIYEQAANKGDLESLQPILAPGFSGVMVTGEEVTSFASLQQYWASIKQMMGEGGTYQVQVNVTDHAFIAGDLAVAHGTTDEVVNARGNEYRFQGRWTAVCRKQDGEWQLLRVHASMPAISNPFVAATVRAATTTVAIIAGLVGLVAGWILHVIAARRRKPAVAV